ncbi:MAG: 4'-phosphopantetheinyl transferase superfamily protein, partial [Gemmatimonadota bacterium]
MDSLYALLSSNERVRASRIRRDRDRWVVARSLLRCVLGGCLGRDPDAIEFRPGRNDKPELAPDDSRPVPRFNLSHSGRMVLIAVAGAPVGVDVERVRDPLDVTGLSRHVLRSAEIEALNGIPAPRRPEAFIAAWTRKEAYLKARALGIGGVQSVRVNVDPDDPAELLVADGDPDGVAGWT